MDNYLSMSLFAGGIYNTLLVIFHISFWKLEMFNWKEELKKMSAVNSSIMQMFNVACIISIATMAYLTFFHAEELLTTSLGRAILGCFSIFWLARLAEQFIWGAHGFKNNCIVAACISPGFVFYIIPLLGSYK